MIIKTSTQKSWVNKGTEFAGEFKKLCKEEILQIYSTMSETKAAFAERTIRSLEKTPYRYMEDNGYQYIQKLSQFITTLNSRKSCSKDLLPKISWIPIFCPLSTGSQYEIIEKTKFKYGDRLRISKNDSAIRTGYEPKHSK